MSDDPKPPAPEPSGLQFDRAESKDPQPAAQVACAACKSPLVDQYFVVRGAKLCPNCSGALNQHLESGSKGARLLKATLLGLLAALVGGGLWALFIVKTNSMWGFVAIGLGYLVGLAVRKGSEGRGGRGYQFLGLALVYVAVATGYMGVIMSELADRKAPAVQEKKDKPGEKPAPAADASKPIEAKPVEGGCVGAALMFLVFYVGSPLLVGKEDPFTFLFLAIALWEAWRLNAGLNLKVSGPFRLGGTTAPEKAPDG
ncbi:MAG: hypothetical protein JO332_02570 [Planctomycetaceae bacterium]|nr:hypothetical protein [Planctomycetaceae bacterium]